MDEREALIKGKTLRTNFNISSSIADIDFQKELKEYKDIIKEHYNSFNLDLNYDIRFGYSESIDCYSFVCDVSKI